MEVLGCEKLLRIWMILPHPDTGVSPSKMDEGAALEILERDRVRGQGLFHILVDREMN